MYKKRLPKILIIILALFAVFFCFYNLMTYDRNYTWAKEYKEELTTIAEKNRLSVIKTEKINVADIKRSIEKKIKIRIQKFLSGVNLMNYGKEFGESTLIISENSTSYFNCKGWCLDDHLIGLEMEYSNIDEIT